MTMMSYSLVRTRGLIQLGEHHVTPINTDLVPRHSSHELPSHKVSTSGGSYWTNPKKERQIGSPGNTANIDYFMSKQTPQVVEINFHKPGEEIRTDSVRRGDIVPGRRNVIRSAPARQSHTRQGGAGQGVTDRNHYSKLHKVYNPGHSESDLTSQSEDETR